MRRTLLPLLSALVVLATPALASADSFDDVFNAYQGGGRIDPCKFSPDALQSARSQIPNDIEQYAPDFPNALDAALAARARGGCQPGAATTAPTTPEATTPGATAGGGGPPADTTPTPGGTTPQPTPQAVPAAAVKDTAIPVAATRRQSAAETPAALLLLGVLGGLLLVGLLAWGAARWWAWEPAWLVRTRHATAEAGWRASAGWAEFTDWVRLGR